MKTILVFNNKERQTRMDVRYFSILCAAVCFYDHEMHRAVSVNEIEEQNEENTLNFACNINVNRFIKFTFFSTKKKKDEF